MCFRPHTCGVLGSHVETSSVCMWKPPVFVGTPDEIREQAAAWRKDPCNRFRDWSRGKIKMMKVRDSLFARLVPKDDSKKSAQKAAKLRPSELSSNPFDWIIIVREVEITFNKKSQGFLVAPGVVRLFQPGCTYSARTWPVRSQNCRKARICWSGLRFLPSRQVYPRRATPSVGSLSTDPTCRLVCLWLAQESPLLAFYHDSRDRT